MTSILLKVTGAKAQASVNGPLTAGMVGIPVTVEYDEAWEGLRKNLVCRCGQWGPEKGETRTILNVEESATVAHEVMQADMYLYLAIEGCTDDGKLVIPTTWASCGKIQHGADVGADPSANPRLAVWNQLQTEIREIRQEAVTQDQVDDIQAWAQTASQAAFDAEQARERAVGASNIAISNANAAKNAAAEAENAEAAAAASAQTAVNMASNALQSQRAAEAAADRVTDTVENALADAMESGVFDGEDGYTPIRGVDYYTDADRAEFEAQIAAELAKRGQLRPEFANSIEECTDTTKLYVLPDGMIYAYMLTEKEVETSGGYTNLLPLATDTDRTAIYGGDYDGDGDNDGYMTGYRLSSSGSLTALSNACVSGFIPASEGDVLRIKNTKPIPASTSCYVITYSSSNAKVAYKSLGTTSDFSDWDSPSSTPYVTYTDGVLMIPLTSEYFGEGFDAIRFSAGTIDETSIVTINEEIAAGGGTETVTEYAWVSTGHAFVPAEDEHRYDIFDYAYIKNGELIANKLDITGTQHGHYTGVKMSGSVRRIMCRARIVPNASVVLISTKLGSAVVANITRGSIHLIFNSDGCSVGIYDGGSAPLRNVVQYSCPVSEDTEVAFGYTLDETANTMTVYLPDGTVKTLTDDALSAVNGQYAIWEHFCSAASAGFTCCRITKLWCEDVNGEILDDDLKRLDGAIGVAPTGQPYRQFRTGQQTSRDFS